MTLANVGLMLTPDGILYGRPSIPLTASGTTNLTVAFTVGALDSTNTFAFSRSGTAVHQQFILNIEPTASANSEISASSVELASNHRPLTVNGETLDSSFKYTGYFDPKGATLATLAGSPFTLRVDYLKFTGSFDSKGKISKVVDDAGNSIPCKIAVSPSKSTVSISIPNAQLKATAGPGISGAHITGPLILAMEFYHYHACEALTVDGSAIGSKFMVRYRVGSIGQSMAGSAQVYIATGIDQTSSVGSEKGMRGDTWVVRYIGVPRASIDTGASTAFPVFASGGANAGSTASVTIEISDTFRADVVATLRVCARSFCPRRPATAFTNSSSTVSVSFYRQTYPSAWTTPEFHRR